MLAHYAVVEFEKTWVNFCHIMTLAKDFEIKKHGRAEWFDSEKSKDDELYGWIATQKDYNLSDHVGNGIKENGYLKTVAAVQTEEEAHHSILATGFQTTINKNVKLGEEEKHNISEADYKQKKIFFSLGMHLQIRWYSKNNCINTAFTK